MRESSPVHWPVYCGSADCLRTVDAEQREEGLVCPRCRRVFPWITVRPGRTKE